MQEIIDQIKFVKAMPPYRAGEVAGFPPDKAELYVKAGACAFVRRGVPKTDPIVATSDVRQQVEALAARLTSAERDAKRAAKAPETAASAAEAMRAVADTRRVLDALREQLEAGAQAAAIDAARLPSASGAAV